MDRDRDQPQAKGACGKAPKQKGQGRLGGRPEAGSVPASDRGAVVAGSASSHTTSALRAQRDGTAITTTISATNTAHWYSGEPIHQAAALRYAPYPWPTTMIRNNTGVAGYARYPVTGPVMPTPYGPGVWRPYRRANGLQFSVQPTYRPPVMRAPAAFRYGVYSQQVTTIHQHRSIYNPYPQPPRPRPEAAPIQIIPSGSYRPESPTNNEPTVTSTTTSSNGANQA